MAKPIIRTKTGGYSLLTLLMGLAGISLLVVQAIVLLGPSTTADRGISLFVPGLIGIGLLLTFLLSSAHGHAEVYPDRITGRTAARATYDIPFSDLAEPDPRQRSIALKAPDGTSLATDKQARYRKLPGLIWLLKNYPEMQPERWQNYMPIETKPQHQAIRYFFEGEEGIFGDRGMVLEVGGSSWFIPLTLASLLPQHFKEKGELAVHPHRQPPVPQQDPNPAFLPLEAAWKAMREAGLEDEALSGIAETWARDHGGCLLEADSEGRLVGKVSEWDVQVFQ